MKKNYVSRVLSVAFLVTLLLAAPMLSACSSSESPAPEDVASQDPKYAVQIFIDCDQNIAFSKYDVDVIVDGTEIGNVEHGGEATFEADLIKGQHELSLVKEGRTSPDGKTSFVVNGDGDTFSYKIHCTKDQIEIESIKEDAEEQAESEADGDDADKPEAAPVDKDTEEHPESEVDGNDAKKSEEAPVDKDAAATKQAQLIEELEACKGQSVAHAYSLVKDSGLKYTFEVADTHFGSDITSEIDNEYYAGARERAQVSEVSVSGSGSPVTFTVDRPLAMSTDDNEDLSALLNDSNITTADPMLSDFVEKYEGINIEFDGIISAHFRHGNLKTRFDYFVIAGDSTDSGMPFFYENINYSDFHWTADGPESVDANLRCHFVAEVKKYDMAIDSVPMIYLDPIATTLL